jgi:hypothetical protein
MHPDLAEPADRATDGSFTSSTTTRRARRAIIIAIPASFREIRYRCDCQN